MTGTCENCGDDVTHKNAAGHYRDTCADCLDEIAAERDRPADHDCAECGDPAVGRPDGTWLCGGCWTGIEA